MDTGIIQGLYRGWISQVYASVRVVFGLVASLERVKVPTRTLLVPFKLGYMVPI